MPPKNRSQPPSSLAPPTEGEPGQEKDVQDEEGENEQNDTVDKRSRKKEVPTKSDRSGKLSPPPVPINPEGVRGRGRPPGTGLGWGRGCERGRVGQAAEGGRGRLQ
jgi:hypothetical protein